MGQEFGRSLAVVLAQVLISLESPCQQVLWSPEDLVTSSKAWLEDPLTWLSAGGLRSSCCTYLHTTALVSGQHGSWMVIPEARCKVQRLWWPRFGSTLCCFCHVPLVTQVHCIHWKRGSQRAGILRNWPVIWLYQQGIVRAARAQQLLKKRKKKYIS